MIKVYFETSSYSELVACFDDEQTYNACLLALEKLAKDNGFDSVTESVDDESNLRECIRVHELAQIEKKRIQQTQETILRSISGWHENAKKGRCKTR
jgi:hypothetical protein